MPNYLCFNPLACCISGQLKKFGLVRLTGESWAHFFPAMCEHILASGCGRTLPWPPHHRDVGIGVFPKGKEALIGLASICLITLQSVGTCYVTTSFAI